MGSSVWTTKPMLGSVIDYSNPLSRGIVGCWLMNERGGLKVKNLVNPSKYNGVLTSNFWSNNELKFDGSTTYTEITPVVSGTATFLVIGMRDRNTPANYLDSVIGIYTGTTGYYCLMFGNGWSGAGDNYVRTEGSASTAVSLYVNGVRQTSNVQSNSKLTNRVFYNVVSSYTGITAGTNFRFGDYQTQNWHLSGGIKVVYYWNRVLSPQEIQSLYVSPYQFIEQPSRRMYSILTGGLVWSTSEVVNVV